MINSIIFVSPHSKKIGETYVLPRLLRTDVVKNTSPRFYLFNVCGEWDSHVEEFGDRIIPNRCRWISRLSPNIERISPWWNYRIWLFFVSVSIAIGLPLSLGKRRNTAVVMRMATSGGAVAARLASKLVFIASMAGVPHATLLRRLSWPFLYRSYDTVVTPCESMKAQVAMITGKSGDRIKVLRNAVLEDNAEEQTLFENKFDGTTLRIVMVGRLTRQKGVDTAINAISKLNFPACLTLVGEGEDLGALRALSEKLDVSESLSFVGYKPEPEKEMVKHDVFIMPSRWEGPGHSIIEALSIGMPSVVSNCPYGPEETVNYGSYGGVCQTDDSDSLALELTKVYERYEDYVSKAVVGARSCAQYRASGVASSWRNFVDQL